MYSLSLCIENDQIGLHGPQTTLPLHGCRRLPGQRLANNHTLEVLELILQGSAGQNRAWIGRLQSFLQRINQGQSAVLSLQSEPREFPYESRIYSADFQWIVGSLQPKGIGLRLQLERDDFWEGPAYSLPLSNRYGSRVTGGLRVDNRADTFGENQVRWLAEDVSGELPAPAQLLLAHKLGSNAVPQNMYAGHLRAVEDNLAVLEGETAASDLSNTLLPDAGCQGGVYRQVEWQGSAEQELLRWQFEDVFKAVLQSVRVRPFLRLPAAAPVVETCWLRWVISQGGIVYQSQMVSLQPGLQLQALPILQLPATHSKYPHPASYRVSLLIQAQGEGSHVLAVDAIFLLGLDGWRHFQPYPGGSLMAGQTLIDFGAEQQPLLLEDQSGTVAQTYAGLGGGIWVCPYEDQSFQFLADSGTLMPLDAYLELEIRYRPRVRMLV
ncbi:MAG: hypothetical protein BGO78_14240 [Chloroflexi bacterium 44-23]|nr:MAG: hypothetical protein BGO78_14240 [Chloroflexi bacterium 44-23]